MRPFEIRWTNFRSFADTGWITIKPLTIILGRNNSGKTALLSPLLLMNQTLASSNPALALKLHGPLTKVGTFSDIVRDHRPDATMTFALRYRAIRRKPPRDAQLGAEPPIEAQMDFVQGETPLEVALARFQLRDALNRPLLTRRRSKRGSYSVADFDRVVGSLTTRRPRKRDDREVAILRLIRASRPQHFLFTTQGVFSDFFRQEVSFEETREVTFQLSQYAAMYSAITAYAQQGITRVLRALSYIGPLRERPRRFYEVTGEMPRSVGTRGQFAPEILFRQQNPALLRQINSWLHRFDFPGTIKPKPYGDEVFALGFDLGGGRPWFNIADVGFGLSQVLPLLVEGLTSPANAIIVAEQANT